MLTMPKHHMNVTNLGLQSDLGLWKGPHKLFTGDPCIITSDYFMDLYLDYIGLPGPYFL